MKALVQMYLLVMLCDVLNAIQTPRIELLSPKGIIFNVKDEGYNLVGIHYSINSQLFGRAAGRWNFDITEKTGNDWIHKNPLADVSPGDTVYYWVHVIMSRNGLGDDLLNQIYTVPDLTCDKRQHFTCDDGRCISDELRCNGVTNCGDNSDERNCGLTRFVTISGKTSPNTPDEGKTPPTTSTEGRSSVLSMEEVYGIIGAVLGTITIVCLTIVCVVFIRRRNARQSAKDAEDNLKQNGRVSYLTPTRRAFNSHDLQSRNTIPDIYDYAESEELGYTTTEELPKYESLLRERDLPPLPDGSNFSYEKLNPSHPYLEVIG